MKVQLTWFGKAAGRSAGTIYQSYFGNTYTRAMPFSFHYPDTQKQQKTQASFFDIQRNWLPIYSVLQGFIDKSQRYNKNTFNVLSTYIYRVFNPYIVKAYEHLPKDFGLNSKNLLIPNISDFSLEENVQSVILTFQNGKPIQQIDIEAQIIHILLFNKTTIEMMYKNEKITYGKIQVKLENTMYWKPQHNIVTYIALSSKQWLGNFNLIN